MRYIDKMLHHLARTNMRIARVPDACHPPPSPGLNIEFGPGASEQLGGATFCRDPPEGPKAHRHAPNIQIGGKGGGAMQWRRTMPGKSGAIFCRCKVLFQKRRPRRGRFPSSATVPRALLVVDASRHLPPCRTHYFSSSATVPHELLQRSGPRGPYELSSGPQ